MGMGRGKIAAVTASALATAGLAAGAVAATTSGGTDRAGDLAAAINARAGTSITGDDVAAASLDVLKERLDEAVGAGRLTQERADEMLQRAKDNPGMSGGLGGPGGPGGHGRGGHVGDVLDAVAPTLKLTEAELQTKLAAGSTLAAIAKAQGVARADLITTISEALEADGVPAARADGLAARIADPTRPERGGPGGGQHP